MVEKAASRQHVAARRRVFAVRTAVAPPVDRLERPRLDVAEDLRPDLHTLADRQRIGVRGDLLGARQDVQPAQDHLRPPLTIPGRQGIGAIGERQMDGDPDDLRERLPGRRSLQQVLIPVGDLPVRRGRPRDARQCQRGREDVLAVAGMWVLGIKRVDQESRLPARRTRVNRRVKEGAHRSARGIHGDFMGESFFQMSTNRDDFSLDARGEYFALQTNSALRYKVRLSRAMIGLRCWMERFTLVGTAALAQGGHVEQPVGSVLGAQAGPFLAFGSRQ